jgi:hypothetical protein
VERRYRIRFVVGCSAVICSALYLLSDVIEASQAGFSAGQLWLTLVAEAAIPPIVLAIYALVRPRIGRLGLVAAGGYAVVYAFFAWTVAYALANGTPDFDALTRDLDPWMTVGGAVMVIAGSAFGIAWLRAAIVPRWPAIVFTSGVVLVALASGLSEPAQLVAAGLRDVGLAAMGGALLLPSARRRASGAADRDAADVQTVHVRGPRPTPAQLFAEISDAAASVPLAIAAPFLRRWHSRWGATDAEVAAAMPGDDVVPGCQVHWTRAISINAPPENVWPWLVQVGFGRAGFYSNDLLDNVAHPSASEIQHELSDARGRGLDPDVQEGRRDHGVSRPHVRTRRPSRMGKARQHMGMDAHARTERRDPTGDPPAGSLPVGNPGRSAREHDPDRAGRLPDDAAHAQRHQAASRAPLDRRFRGDHMPRRGYPVSSPSAARRAESSSAPTRMCAPEPTPKVQ